jgi:hypothetical protein
MKVLSFFFSLIGLGGAVLQAWPLMPRLSAMRRLSYLLLPMITLFKLQVFGMVPRIERRYYQYSMITSILRTLTIRRRAAAGMLTYADVC